MTGKATNKELKLKGAHKKKSKKQKQITWNDFTREELIEIAKRYKEITEDKNET